MDIAIGIILIISAIFLVVAVLMQDGKSHNLSGTIAGGAETFFGKTKGAAIDKKLSKLTTIVAIVFVVLVLVSYLAQGGSPTTNVTPPSNDTTVEENEADEAGENADEAGDSENAENDADVAE